MLALLLRICWLGLLYLQTHWVLMIALLRSYIKNRLDEWEKSRG